jgi:hypothetical protein
MANVKTTQPPAWVVAQQQRAAEQQRKLGADPNPVQNRVSRPMVNPRNYLRPDPRRAKVIDLNKMMQSWGKNQAKYKEGDVFISKKILQNLKKAEDFAGVVSQPKFKENVKEIDDIKSEGKGVISYKFKGADGYLAEDVMDQNYIHNYKDNVWQYYKEKNKNEN